MMNSYTDLHLRAASDDAMMAALRAVGLTATDEDGVERVRSAAPPGTFVAWLGPIGIATGEHDDEGMPIIRPVKHSTSANVEAVERARGQAKRPKAKAGRETVKDAGDVHVNIRTVDAELASALEARGVLIEAPETPRTVWAS